MTDRDRIDAMIQSAVGGCYPYWSTVIADYLVKSGVVVREKGEWILHMDGSSTCKKCRTNTKYSWDFDNSFNFCPTCGADMRKEKNE